MDPIQPDVSKNYPEIPLLCNNCETPVGLKRIVNASVPTATDDDDDDQTF